jgi:hypothetical protein
VERLSFRTVRCVALPSREVLLVLSFCCFAELRFVWSSLYITGVFRGVETARVGRTDTVCGSDPFKRVKTLSMVKIIRNLCGRHAIGRSGLTTQKDVGDPSDDNAAIQRVA